MAVDGCFNSWVIN